MIYYSIPYNTEKNLGKYYNEFMKILPKDDDYACFVDGDTIFTTPNYGTTIDNIIKKYPNVGCFTAMTNRVACKWQVVNGIDVNNNDMAYHREIGQNMQDIYRTYCVDVTKKTEYELMSGFLILIKKSVWKKIGKFTENGMLGIDNDLHSKIQKHNEKMYLMMGVYLYHWYRWPDIKNINHLL